MQISLYETGDVSVQFGTNNLDSVPVGVGLIKKTSGINLADGVLLMGDPASASKSTLIGQKLMHAPNSGTLYHFSRSAIASVEDQTLEVEMYQNINEIKFDESYESIKLYNLNGAMVKQIRKDNSITIEDLTTGLYILVVESDNKIFTKKVLKS